MNTPPTTPRKITMKIECPDAPIKIMKTVQPIGNLQPMNLSPLFHIVSNKNNQNSSNG